MYIGFMKNIFKKLFARKISANISEQLDIASAYKKAIENYIAGEFKELHRIISWRSQQAQQALFTAVNNTNSAEGIARKLDVRIYKIENLLEELIQRDYININSEKRVKKSTTKKKRKAVKR